MSELRTWMNLCETVSIPSRKNLSELKSFDELFGPNAVYVEREEDIFKSEKILISHGWERIPWKHPLGIFEWAFINPKFNRYYIFLMDLDIWEVREPSGKIHEGKGSEQLGKFLNDYFGQEL